VSQEEKVLLFGTALSETSAARPTSPQRNMTFTADVESVLAAAVRKHTKAELALSDDQFLADLNAHQKASPGTEDYHKKVLDFSLRVRLDEITVS
jgi:hypothetical protein